MKRHVIGQFATHEQAEIACLEAEKHFPGRVSMSSKTHHKHWWTQDRLVDSSLQTIGGLAATVSQLVPGFGMLFMGGTLDGMMQGHLLADWLEAHPQFQEREMSAFIVITAKDDELDAAKQLLLHQGGQHIHLSRP